MFKEKYYKMNEKICPSNELIENVINNADKKKRKGNKEFVRIRRPIIAICVFSICILTMIPVLAATVPQINDLMYLVSPSVAQFFKPVQKSCEDNGIKMEVLATYIHENTAEVYITMQDLEGERVDETTDLNDSYNISIPFDNSAYCQFVGYDDITKTATFLINISAWENNNITGDKLTFSVREFLSQKKEYNDVLVKENLTNISENLETMKVSLTGCGGTNYKKYISENTEEVKVLKPLEPMRFPVSGIDFTGIGYIDGMLHIQTAVVNNLNKCNHGYFILKDKEGNEMINDYSVGFLEEVSNTRIDYQEYIFNIPKSEIQNYSLYGDFVITGMCTEGNWEVTFPLEN